MAPAWTHPDAPRPGPGTALPPPSGDPVGHPGGELRSLARSGALTIAGVAAFGLLGFLFNVIAARALGPRGAGLVFEAVAITTITATMTRLGGDVGLLQQLPRLRALGRSSEVPRTILVALIPSVVAGGLAAWAIWVLSPQIAALVFHFHSGGTGEPYARYIRWQAPFIPLAAAAVVMLAGARGLATTKPYVLVDNIATPLLRVVATLGVSLAGLGALAVSLTWAAPLALGAVAAAAVLATILRRQRAERARSRHPRAWRVTASEFWSFSGPRSLAGAAAVLVSWLDIILVGALKGPGPAGVYNAVSRYVMVGLFAFSAIRVAMGPQLSRLLAQGRREEAQLVFQSATYWLVSVSWPFYLALALFAPTMLRIFGRSFSRAGATALLVLALAELYDMGTGNVTLVLLMGGKSSWNLFNACLALAANVSLNLVLIPRLGLTGAAIAWAASILIENTAAIIQVRFLLRLSPFGPGYPAATLAGTVLVVVGAAARLSLGQSFPALAAWVGVGGILYLATLWRFRRQLHFGPLGRALLSRARPQPMQPLGP
jgi:O-antigen/teichoic acid export membrane protein